ncbi:hypothetical protein Nepgr_007733 [Nepenthes gracilis]|uniref:TIR domain-containing protein n=1 Tax=Nepenthes gracilis TaxID=150966 RepID=A0AAD3XIK4_NEPGR|nr:hypothetical protein Nepgr_007733 [Nepenthes gracilis]
MSKETAALSTALSKAIVDPSAVTDNGGLNGPAKSLTIKTSSCGSEPSREIPAPLESPITASSPYNSPSLISPPSSAFVSALQSPYISPRAVAPTLSQTEIRQPPTHPSPAASFCGSLSEDIPSSSYTPPPERSDFSDNPKHGRLKFATCVPGQVPDPPPRISFSFPNPRISLAKGSISPAVNAKLRSCDVFIGYHGQNPNLARFCKWLKSELEQQGIACFVADRASYADGRSHEIADRVICSVTFGIVVVSRTSFFNRFSTEEIKFFAQKKNLVPVFFDTDPTEIIGLLKRNSDDKERKEATDGLIRSHEFNLEANGSDWRSCISKATSILRAKLGRTSITEREPPGAAELPFPRSRNFVGREREIMEIESNLFGNWDCLEQECPPPSIKGSTSGQSGGFADEESDMDRSGRVGRCINLELTGIGGPTLEPCAEPAIGRNLLKRPKYKKSKGVRDKGAGCTAVCISGPPGAGKTQLALEFACRHSQRYKMVLWVGGEARSLRQNILNLSLNLGLDVTADPEKERGRIRSFEEQEYEAFKRVKRALFRDMPYLVIIDNLETENEWWEGKDLHDLIPRNTGGSHVIVTTRLPKVMNLDPVQLQPLPFADATALLQGRRKKYYPAEDAECLANFSDKLERSTFGLSVVGSLLSELAISPSALYEAVNQLPLEEASSSSFGGIVDEQFCRNNAFLMKLFGFCFAILEKAMERGCIASRMLLVGAWYAPAPISSHLLATAAKNLQPTEGNQLRKWTKCLNFVSYCFSGCQVAANPTCKSEEESALVLVKLGLAQISTCQPGLWIQFHPITRIFARRIQGSAAAKAAVLGARKIGNPLVNSDHLWASAFLVFGYQSEAPSVQLTAAEMVLFIKKTALPLANRAFTVFSRCNSALELLNVCTNVLEEVEKSFVSQIGDWHDGPLCWRKKLQDNQRVEEYVWQDVTLLKAALLETRAKLLLRGAHFDSAEELCRTCISIRTVMLGHNHAQTLAAQETLAKLVRLRSKM